MGMFMSSVAFRYTKTDGWAFTKARIKAMCSGVDGLVDNLDSDGPGYAIVSPYGDMGSFLAELPEKISRLTKDYVVFATCVDSDFNLLALYQNGVLLENSCVGEVYEEYAEFMEINAPEVEHWEPLLLDKTQRKALEAALNQDQVFAEDHLRLLTELTGIPIFDDEMMDLCC